MLFFAVDAATCAANFQVNDDGRLVPVGVGNNFTDGLTGLWGGTVDVFGDGSFIPAWGIPIEALGFAGTTDTTDILKIGSAVPDFNLGVSQTLRWKGVSLYTLFDAQIGGDIYNQTRQWNLREDRAEQVDQRGKAQGNWKPLAYYSKLYRTNDVNSEFVESGTYLKLRELALRYTFGSSQLEGILGGAVKRISVALVARNLITWTGYSGFDPEVGRGQAALLRFDNFGYPNFRTVGGSVELEF